MRDGRRQTSGCRQLFSLSRHLPRPFQLGDVTGDGNKLLDFAVGAHHRRDSHIPSLVNPASRRQVALETANLASPRGRNGCTHSWLVLFFPKVYPAFAENQVDTFDLEYFPSQWTHILNVAFGIEQLQAVLAALQQAFRKMLCIPESQFRLLAALQGSLCC